MGLLVASEVFKACVDKPESDDQTDDAAGERQRYLRPE
jgi:hypothetical protein